MGGKSPCHGLEKAMLEISINRMVRLIYLHSDYHIRQGVSINEFGKHLFISQKKAPLCIAEKGRYMHKL